MSGPNSHAAAEQAAKLSRQCGTTANTTNWSYTSRQTYYGNGGTQPSSHAAV